MRLYAGSSDMEATRPVSVAAPSPPTPRAPKNAPVPPVTVTFACKKLEGTPGGREAHTQPVAMMFPTCLPSACLTSNTQSKKNEAPLSAIASPGDTDVPRDKRVPRTVHVPLA